MGNAYAYLRVSTAGQDFAKNRADVLEYANSRDLGKVVFVEETVSSRVEWRHRKLGDLIDSLVPGDVLIVPEMSRLGRSMLEIMEILNQCMCREIRVHAVKGNWTLDGSLQSKVLAMAFSIAAEIERDLISSRTREALKARKAAGVRLGRPSGPGSSKLDPYLPEMLKLLAHGSTQKYIAARFGTTPANLSRFLKMRNIDLKTVCSPKNGR